jgi:hypothetical protein
MANSIKTYSAVADAAYVYTTPQYIESADIKVYVDDVLQPVSAYTLSNTALTFNSVLTEGQDIRIERQSEASSRLVSYTDGSLLNAETLDKDANQVFNVAQEAYDQSRTTNMASGKFYYSQEQEPTDKVAGTLWYNKSKTPNVLEIYDGSEWYAAAPIKDVTKLTQADVITSDQGLDQFAYSGYNASSDVYLNGVRLIKGYDAADITNGDGDYYELHGSLVVGSLTATDVLEVITYSGGYSTEVAEKEASVTSMYTTFTTKHTDVDPKLDEVIALDLTTKMPLIEAAEVNAVAAAATATAKAAETTNPIKGWALLDNETIQTQGNIDPEVVAAETFTIKAGGGIFLDSVDRVVKANGSPLPVCAGEVVLDPSNPTWNGDIRVTVSRDTTSSPNRYKLEGHPDLISMDGYMVMATHNARGYTQAYDNISVKVGRQNGYFQFIVQALDNNGNLTEVTSGSVMFTIYKI